MKTLVFILLVCLSMAVDDDFSSAQYQSLSANDKMSKLWSKITEDQTPAEFYNPLILASIFIESMNPTFDHQADSFPFLRKKLIHTVGVIAKGELVMDPANGYSGVFEGASNVLIRLSVAKKPDFTKTTADGAQDNFTPGMSLKFLRDGLPSANIVAMYGVNGFPSWNYFFKDFSNHIPPAQGLALKTLACKFATATKYIMTVGLKDMASWNEKGQDRSGEVSFPFKLIFRPTDKVKNLFPDDFVAPYTDQLKTIPAGTVLYDVYALDTPDSQEKKIGSLRTNSAFVTSVWGDESYFIQHGFMDDDLGVHPEWVDKTPHWSLF